MPEIQMPKLSDTMTEGTLVAWKKKKPEGEEEKEEEKPDEDKEKEKEPKKEEEKKKPEKKGEPKKEKKEKAVEAGVSPAPTQPTPQPQEARVKASPVARRIAAEFGVDLASVKGTGPEGRVTETDVRAAAKSVAAVADRGKPGVQVK